MVCVYIYGKNIIYNILTIWILKMTSTIKFNLPRMKWSGLLNRILICSIYGVAGMITENIVKANKMSFQWVCHVLFTATMEETVVVSLVTLALYIALLGGYQRPSLFSEYIVSFKAMEWICCAISCLLVKSDFKVPSKATA